MPAFWSDSDAYARLVYQQYGLWDILDILLKKNWKDMGVSQNDLKNDWPRDPKKKHTHLDKIYSTFCAKFMTKNVPS